MTSSCSHCRAAGCLSPSRSRGRWTPRSTASWCARSAPRAFEVARALDAPLDVFLVRKLGVPGHEELALGAIATGGTRVLNRQMIETLDIPPEWIEAIDAKERSALARRE